MVKIITFWEVSDVYSVDGVGSSTVIGRFNTKDTATAYSKGKGNYGKHAKVNQVTMQICDTLADIEQAKKNDKIAKALEKLTDEEKELLGIKSESIFP